MAAYLDTSALVKLLVEEADGPAMLAHLGDQPVLTSRIGVVELGRTAARLGIAEAVVRAQTRRLTVVPITEATLERAVRLPPPVLRTLDAIHVAAAESIRLAIDEFVTYDRRQAEAASLCGLAVVTPQ